MKKLLSVLLAVIIITGLSSCSASPAVDAEIPASKNEVAEIKSTATEATPAPTPATIETPEPENPWYEVDEQILLNQEGIKITLKGLDVENWRGPEFKVLVENNTNEKYTIQVRNSSINGVMMDASFSCDVEAGKKANDGIGFALRDFESSGISIIKDVELSFHVFDDDWDTYFDSDQIVFETHADESYVQKYEADGIVALDQDGFKVIVTGVDYEAMMGADVLVYIENNSGKNVTMQLRDTSVNGFMIDPVFSCDVRDGKKAYDAFGFRSRDLDENSVEKIDTLEFSLHIFEDESWDDVLDTEKITIELKQ